MEFKKNLKYTIIGVIALLIIAMVTAGDTVITNTGMTSDTLDTGQGANELYDMDQDVTTSDSPIFAGGTFNDDVKVYDSNTDANSLLLRRDSNDGLFTFRRYISDTVSKYYLYFDATAPDNDEDVRFNFFRYTNTSGERNIRIYKGDGTDDRFMTFDVDSSLLDAGLNRIINIGNAGTEFTSDGTLNIQNGGTGDGLYIDQNGDGNALKIDSEGSGLHVIDVEISNSNSKSGIRLESDDNSLLTILARGSGFGANWFRRDRNSSRTDAPVMFIEQDNSGDDQPALKVQNDGTGGSLSITQNGNTCNINVDADATCDSGTEIAEDNNIALCLVCS